MFLFSKTNTTNCLSKLLAPLLLVSLSSCSSDDDPVAIPSEPQSVAREWNEVLLDAIRNDLARPTVHARNLFHSSAAAYDAWAAYATTEDTYLLGKTLNSSACAFSAGSTPTDLEAFREEAISYAFYRLIIYRFANSPGAGETSSSANALMISLGYDTSITSTDYSDGSAAHLGNYIANCYINYGLADGSNEAGGYENQFYSPVNPKIEPEQPGNPDIIDLDRWQPISLSVAIDQAGNLISSEPEFLSPEWGQVYSFALSDSDKSTFNRDGFDYQVFFDPGSPPSYQGSSADTYKWNFALVSIWSSHLDPGSGVTLDISPASLGNNDILSFPTDFANFDSFYELFDGGDISSGYSVNPHTGAPYPEQVVPLGDYARVLAEFWADGPDSETPPGHWFVLLNEVNDHPDLEKRLAGTGDELGNLEWDVKAYFTLGGAMHDAAISAWGIKGYYDYIRPVSAIRAMADRGQSSDSNLASYHVDGIPLYDGFIELVESGDALAGNSDENVGKIKLYAWRGPTFISNAATDVAGVDWILAEDWWPYQRPSFVTPPFAGYVSGHSTYSRAAAEVLTAFTGDAYFPGGVGEFEIEANEFLVFEDGPSIDMTLQWATYRDASDQCSLSRIWGGIHPPADDLPGRIIGEQIGLDAYAKALTYFNP